MLRTALLATAALAAASLAGPTAPASAEIAIPVNCQDGATISGDGLTYDLQGPCGDVLVTASNATVHMPAATRLVVRGAHNTIDADPVQQVRVHGHDQDLTIRSTKRVVVASPGSRIHFGGLVEHARVPGNRSRLDARRIDGLKVSGNHNAVSARHGYDARFGGDHNRATWTWLDQLVVPGDDNTLGVRRGSTETTVTGAGNDLDLNHAV